MNTLRILKDARELITDPKHWTTEESARDAEGEPVHSASPHAVCWCALGAITKTSMAIEGYGDALDLLQETSLAQGGRNPAQLNDSMGHDAVIRLFDAAIARASTPDHSSWYSTAQGTWWHPSLQYPGRYTVSPNNFSPLQLAVVDDFGTLVIIGDYPSE